MQSVPEAVSAGANNVDARMLHGFRREAARSPARHSQSASAILQTGIPIDEAMHISRMVGSDVNHQQRAPLLASCRRMALLANSCHLNVF